MSFGENLQAIRKKNHLTQEGLAGKAGRPARCELSGCVKMGAWRRVS